MTIHFGKCTLNCDLCLQQFTNDFNMPKSAVLDIVQCKKTEAAGTIVYASDHKKMRVYPVSTVSRKSLLKSHKIRSQIMLKAVSLSLL